MRDVRVAKHELQHVFPFGSETMDSVWPPKCLCISSAGAAKSGLKVMSFMHQPDPLRNPPLVRQPQPGEKRAAGWQIALTAVGAIVIVVVFLWGISNQRDENGGQQTVATHATPATPQGADQQGGQPQGKSQQSGQQQQGSNNASTTTGQGGNDQGHATPASDAEQTSGYQPNNSGQDKQSGANKGQSPQPDAGAR
jgi:hypothetical protein